MQYENLLIEAKEGVLIVTINRPKAMNAINNGVMSELNHFFKNDAPNRTNYHGVIITGAGEKAFVAGADIKGLLGHTAESALHLTTFGHETFFAIERFDRPVIAAVNGFALGGGCELAMSCHMRIASEQAKFGQPEVNLGIIPGYGGTQRLTQLIGKGKSMELTLTGDMIGAAEAQQLGLVNHVVPAEELMDKSMSILKKIGRKGPLAVAKSIEMINNHFDETKDGFALEAQNFADMMFTEDFKEGATAFIEKRRANFQGK